MEACLYRDEQKKQYQQKSPCSNLPIPKKKNKSNFIGRLG